MSDPDKTQLRRDRVAARKAAGDWTPMRPDEVLAMIDKALNEAGPPAGLAE